MVLGLDKIWRDSKPGIPGGQVHDWLPEEFLCSEMRAAKSDARELFALM